MGTRGACAQGGKCQFKFAMCSKCGKQGYGVPVRRGSRNSEKLQQALLLDQRVQRVLECFAKYGGSTASQRETKEIVLSVISSSDFDEDDVDDLMEEAIKNGDSVDDVLKSLRVRYTGGDTDEVFGRTDSDRFGKTDSSKFGKVDSSKFGKADSDRFGKTDSSKLGKVDSSKFGNVPPNQFGRVASNQFGSIDSSKFGSAESDKVGRADSSKPRSRVVHELLKIAGPDQCF